MKNILFKKILLWIVFIVVVVAIIPFFIIFKYKTNIQDEKIPKNNENLVKVYFHKTDETLEMPLNDYIVGVVAAEMPASFEIEALKAQAVATRSYTISKIKANKNSKELHKGADICTDFAHCQAYTSKDEAYENWGSDAKKYYNKIYTAVKDTNNEVLVYNGNVINAVFHASNSGKTESSKDVWGGDLPYLTSTKSYGENFAPKFQSNLKISIDEFKNKLKEEYNDIEFTNLLGEITYTLGGSVDYITIGSKRIKGTKIREIFGLYSANFSIKEENDNIIFNVSGHGHGVGMSQYGANYMASIGKNYKEILENYYLNTTIKEYIIP